MTHRGNGGGGDDGGGDHRGGGDVVGCFPKVCENLHYCGDSEKFPKGIDQGLITDKKELC